MSRYSILLVLTVIVGGASSSFAGEDGRELVELPPMMQNHMMANMRDHLAAINEMLGHLAAGDSEKAAQVAENRLGMSALDNHGAHHMAGFMPEGMRKTGTRMHRAASQFAITVQEGDATANYQALGEITSACVSCHASYRIR